MERFSHRLMAEWQYRRDWVGRQDYQAWYKKAADTFSCPTRPISFSVFLYHTSYITIERFVVFGGGRRLALPAVSTLHGFWPCDAMASSLADGGVEFYRGPDVDALRGRVLLEVLGGGRMTGN